MINKILCLLVIATCFQNILAGKKDNGIFTNPIIFADYSDPDVIADADGNGFYMTASSFQCTPGLPILYSEDLVNWEIVNHALQAVPPIDYYNEEPRHGQGVWAPSIRYHDGLYYIYWGDPDFGIFMIKTSNPREKWSNPVLVKEAKGMIDPTPFWDENGKAYLINGWAASRCDFNSILTLWEMNTDGTELFGQPKIIFDGNDGINQTCEGPKMYKRDGWYYLLCPAGGVKNGWQLALRAKNIYGPYEKKIVLKQGSTEINGPHQGALIDTHDGKSWFIHFQEKQPWGRVIHLNPVEWKDEWPIMGNKCEPIQSHTLPLVCKHKAKHQTSDNFDNGNIGLQWQWHSNYQPHFGMGCTEGFVRIYSHIASHNFLNMWEVPNLLMQKFYSSQFKAIAEVKVTANADGQQSGLIVMGMNYCRLSVEKKGNDFLLKQIICIDANKKGEEIEVAQTDLPVTKKFGASWKQNQECKIWLSCRVDEKGNCKFSYSLDGKNFQDFGLPFDAREGKWIGAKIGFFSLAPYNAERGWIDISSFYMD